MLRVTCVAAPGKLIQIGGQPADAALGAGAVPCLLAMLSPPPDAPTVSHCNSSDTCSSGLLNVDSSEGLGKTSHATGSCRPGE